MTGMPQAELTVARLCAISHLGRAGYYRHSGPRRRARRQSLTVVFNKVSAPHAALPMCPGPLRLSLENRTDLRTLPGVWIAGEGLHALLGQAPTVPHSGDRVA
jgi:Family of unknown function (DUF5939)